MKLEQEWLKKQYTAEGENKPNAYVLEILKVGEKVLDYMEAMGEDEIIYADDLISRADKELGSGITGNMAAYVAWIAVKCHSRGEEFRKSWNKHWGNENSTGVTNPAVITINEKH